jgi:hypothetical protein
MPALNPGDLFRPYGLHARRLGGEPPEARGGSYRVVLSTAARGAPTASHNSACSGMPGRGPPEEGIRVVAPFARRGEHAEVHQQARVDLPGGPQRRRSARAGIDRWVRQPRSRVHSGDRLRAATGREGGGQCVFQRRHRATHARGGRLWGWSATFDCTIPPPDALVTCRRGTGWPPQD